MSNYIATTVEDIQNTRLNKQFLFESNSPSLSLNTWKIAIFIIVIVIFILILVLLYFRHKHKSTNNKDIYLSEKKYKIPMKPY